jgi:hypothetical protein
MSCLGHTHRAEIRQAKDVLLRAPFYISYRKYSYSKKITGLAQFACTQVPKAFTPTMHHQPNSCGEYCPLYYHQFAALTKGSSRGCVLRGLVVEIGSVIPRNQFRIYRLSISCIEGKYLRRRLTSLKGSFSCFQSINRTP